LIFPLFRRAGGRFDPYLLGQIFSGLTPIASAITASSAGQERLSAFPAAVA
jgi:hypothetical protein